MGPFISTKNMGGRKGKGAIKQMVPFLNRLDFKWLGTIQLEKLSGQ